MWAGSRSVRKARGDQIGQQPLALGFLADDGHRFAHVWMLEQGGLDLARLDAEAADLHLQVDPPQEFQRAVRLVPRQVSGAVHPLPRYAAMRIGHELFRGQVGTPQISPSQPSPGDAELAGRTRRHGLKMAVQQVDPGVADRAAEQHRASSGVEVSRHLVAGGEGGALGRTVAGDEPGRGQQAQSLAHVVDRQRLATHQQLPDLEQDLGRFVDHRVVERGRQGQRVDPMLAHHPSQLPDRRHPLLEQHTTATVEQSPPNLHRRSVERHGRELEQGAAPCIIRVVDPTEQAQDPLVADLDPLGTSGRARGVADVGEVLGHHLHGAGPAVAGRDLRRVRIEEDPAGSVRGERSGETHMAEHHRHLRVFQQEGEPGRRIGGVEGNVGSSGLEDGEETNDQIEAAVHVQAHEIAGHHSEGSQVVGQTVRPEVELAIGQRSFAAGDRRGIGHAGGPGGEERVHRAVRGVVCRRVVPLPEQLGALDRREKLQVRARGIRGLGQGGEAAEIVVAEGCDLGGRVPAAVIGQAQLHASGGRIESETRRERKIGLFDESAVQRLQVLEPAQIPIDMEMCEVEGRLEEHGIPEHARHLRERVPAMRQNLLLLAETLPDDVEPAPLRPPEPEL